MTISIHGPAHIAIVMDGNRRWARQRFLPAAMGHASGAKRVRTIVQACADRGVKHLTLFAFSTENWRRPADEVSALMRLLVLYLQKEISDMNARGVRFRVVGDTSGLSPNIQALIRNAQASTAHNSTINLTVAINYGGRWDMLQAVKAWQKAHPDEPLDNLDESALGPYLSTGSTPHPDLLIRTGGESRISNFMLWQLAYTELHFTDVLWPAFTEAVLDNAIAEFRARERRFGGNSAPSATAA